MHKTAIEKIKIKLKEHTDIYNDLTVDMEKLRLKMIEYQSNPSKKKELIMTTMARVTLELKQKFHAGSMEVLKELQKELEDEQ